MSRYYKMRIRQDIAKKILTIGSEYNDHRGGIGAVIASYSAEFAPFKFLPSYGAKSETKISVIVFYMKFILRLFKTLLRDKEIEIVHIHGAAKGSVFRKYIVFNIAKRIFDKKVIFHSHASEMEIFLKNSPKAVRWMCADFFGGVDLIVCLSKSWKQFYVNNFTCKRVEILENIVSEPKLIIDKTMSRPIKLLFLGRVGARKGIFDLLDVLASNKLSFVGKFYLTIGGDGEVDKLTRFIKDNGLEELVDYKGWISGRDKLQLLETSDVYILPSYNEGLPISILEAMSYGLVVVSTYVGGIPEIVTDGKNGYLFNPGDKPEIYNVLIKLIEHEEHLASFRENSFQVVRNYFPDQVIPKLEKFYESLIVK